MYGSTLDRWFVPALIAGSLAGCAALGWAVLRGARRLERAAEAAQRRAFEGLRVHPDPAPGRVFVSFHTYYGFVAFVRQTEYRFWAEPDQAREALGRLHRFNLRWGLLAAGAFPIPLMSYGNLLVQRRSIRRQQAAQAA